MIEYRSRIEIRKNNGTCKCVNAATSKMWNVHCIIHRDLDSLKEKQDYCDDVNWVNMALRH